MVIGKSKPTKRNAKLHAVGGDMIKVVQQVAFAEDADPDDEEAEDEHEEHEYIAGEVQRLIRTGARLSSALSWDMPVVSTQTKPMILLPPKYQKSGGEENGR